MKGAAVMKNVWQTVQLILLVLIVSADTGLFVPVPKSIAATTTIPFLFTVYEGFEFVEFALLPMK